jgi:hypothetical protein
MIISESSFLEAFEPNEISCSLSLDETYLLPFAGFEIEVSSACISL